MPQGFQAFDAGVVVVDITEHLSQYVGSATITPGASGSVTVNGMLPGNRIWSFFMADGNAKNFTLAFPKFVFANNMISWSFDGGATQIGGTLLFGIY